MNHDDSSVATDQLELVTSSGGGKKGRKYHKRTVKKSHKKHHKKSHKKHHKKSHKKHGKSHRKR